MVCIRDDFVDKLLWWQCKYVKRDRPDQHSQALLAHANLIKFDGASIYSRPWLIGVRTKWPIYCRQHFQITAWVKIDSLCIASSHILVLGMLLTCDEPVLLRLDDEQAIIWTSDETVHWCIYMHIYLCITGTYCVISLRSGSAHMCQ